MDKKCGNNKQAFSCLFPLAQTFKGQNSILIHCDGVVIEQDYVTAVTVYNK